MSQDQATDRDYLNIARYAIRAYKAAQYPSEFASILRLVDAIRPAAILEIGCDSGGSLWAWRQLCEHVYGITLPQNTWASGGNGDPLGEFHLAEVALADSHDPASFRWAEEKTHGCLDVLFIDGDHTTAGVALDFLMYMPLVRPGGIVLLHDIQDRGDGRSEVHEVWPLIKAVYGGHEITDHGGPGFGVVKIKPIF